MFEALEQYAEFLRRQPRSLRVILLSLSPVLFSLYAVGMGAFFLFSLLCLAILERRQIIGAIEDSFGSYHPESEGADRIVNAFAKTGETRLTYAQLRELTSLSDRAVMENVKALAQSGKVEASDGYSAHIVESNLAHQ